MSVTGDQRIGIAAISCVSPGFAHAVVGRRLAGLLWMIGGALPCLFGIVGPWMLALVVVVRVVGAIDAYRVARREQGSPPWSGFLPTIVLAFGIAGFVFLKYSLEVYKIPSSSMYPTLAIKDEILVDELTPHWRAPERGEVILFKYPCAPEKTYVKRVIALGGDTVEVRCRVIYVNGEPIKSELVNEKATYNDFDDSTQTWFTRTTSRYREHYAGRTYEIFQNATSETGDFPLRDKLIVPSCQHGEFFDKPKTQSSGSIVAVARIKSPKACELQAHYVVPPGSLFVIGDNRSNANDSRYWGAVSLNAVTGRLISRF